MAQGLPSTTNELALHNLRQAEELLSKQDEMLHNMVSQNNLTLSLVKLNEHRVEFERLFDYWKICQISLERFADPKYLSMIRGYAAFYQKQRNV